MLTIGCRVGQGWSGRETITVFQVRDGGDLGQGNGEWWSDSRYIFMIEPIGFLEGSDGEKERENVIKGDSRIFGWNNWGDVVAINRNREDGRMLGGWGWWMLTSSVSNMFSLRCSLVIHVQMSSRSWLQKGRMSHASWVFVSGLLIAWINELINNNSEQRLGEKLWDFSSWTVNLFLDNCEGGVSENGKRMREKGPGVLSLCQCQHLWSLDHKMFIFIGLRRAHNIFTLPRRCHQASGCMLSLLLKPLSPLLLLPMAAPYSMHYV